MIDRRHYKKNPECVGPWERVRLWEVVDALIFHEHRRQCKGRRPRDSCDWFGLTVPKKVLFVIPTRADLRPS